MNQEYFYIDNCLGVGSSTYVNNREDNDRLSIGNVYPYTKDNKEEVEKQVQLEVDRLKLQIDMRVFAKCNNKDEIEVTLTGSGKIYYTLDGSTPTVSSKIYSSPLTIKETTVLRIMNSINLNMKTLSRI